MSRNIAVIGLGYVGLPLALALAKKSHVIGYDINQRRIDQLKNKNDITSEVFSEEFDYSDIEFTCDEAKLKQADFYIVTVPTPVDSNNLPDLSYLHAASQTVGKALQRGDIVVYESTVYPGCTEEDCAPVLEKYSGLKCGSDFKIGYSPERINPNDRVNTLDKIVKIVSGQDSGTLEIIASIYKQIITAGIYKAESIKIAEAAKVLENTQRDVNISLMNEVAKIFDKLGIDSNKVIDAASSKWNFVNMRPGLVGGHCVGIDPYYLISKAERVGATADLIKTARKVNNSLGDYIVDTLIAKLQNSGKKPEASKIAILGLTFKENCADTRNSRPFEMVARLKKLGVKVLLHDPYAQQEYVTQEIDQELLPWQEIKDIDAMVINVKHNFYKEIEVKDLVKKFNSLPLVLDVRAVLDESECRKYGVSLWRL